MWILAVMWPLRVFHHLDAERKIGPIETKRLASFTCRCRRDLPCGDCVMTQGSSALVCFGAATFGEFHRRTPYSICYIDGLLRKVRCQADNRC